MSSKTDGTIFIFSSPSGAGKKTLVKLVSEKKNFATSISHTTRKPRSKEINGKDYHFVSEKKFQELIKQGQFLEYAKVFNNFYGTSKKLVLQKLKNGENVLFDIDWQGSKQIKNQNIDFNILSFFVLPPSKEILYQRLSNRDMKDKLIASERMKDFYKDVKHWTNYDRVIVNDDLEKCYNEISEVIDNFLITKTIKPFDRILIENHIKKLIT